tara:strand:- start:2011 stop:2205 length:195 start_codon:yes stop_codon:yes gene_type:complete
MIKKARSEKQIENTKKLVERNRLRFEKIRKEKEEGTYVKPVRKKKQVNEIVVSDIDDIEDWLSE